MANRSIFSSSPGKYVPPTDTINHAGGRGYATSPQHTLAQIVCTGTFNGTYYVSGEEQLGTILAVARQCDPEFVAKAAIYGFEHGYMKDAPALLTAYLTTIKEEYPAVLLQSAFHRTIKNGKMLRNFVQMIRSGVVGRKSLGTLPKRLVQDWLASRSVRALINDSVGDKPSLADVIKMVHPRPENDERRSLYAWLIGKWNQSSKLPEEVLSLERFRKDSTSPVPNVEFRLLTSGNLTPAHWTAIAKNAPWQMTRMNLNTFARHSVFEDPAMVKIIAERLRDKGTVSRSWVFPYQLLAAYYQTKGNTPPEISEALQDAMEIATENVPAFEGKVVVCPDVSGSMSSPITGHQAKGATSLVRCIDVASLISAVVVRNNKTATVLPFSDRLFVPRDGIGINPRDSVMTNAEKLASLGGGGTACSLPLSWLNKDHQSADLVIYVSDSESWADYVNGPGTTFSYRSASIPGALANEWSFFKARNPKAKLVLIDLTPNTTSQVKTDKDVLLVGGFSDKVFDVIRDFVDSSGEADFWVKKINEIKL